MSIFFIHPSGYKMVSHCDSHLHFPFVWCWEFFLMLIGYLKQIYFYLTLKLAQAPEAPSNNSKGVLVQIQSLFTVSILNTWLSRFCIVPTLPQELLARLSSVLVYKSMDIFQSLSYIPLSSTWPLLPDSSFDLASIWWKWGHRKGKNTMTGFVGYSLL